MSQWIVLMTPKELEPNQIVQSVERSVPVWGDSDRGTFSLGGQLGAPEARFGEVLPRGDAVVDCRTNGLLPPSFRVEVDRLRFFKLNFSNYPAFRKLMQQLLVECPRLSEVWVDDDYGWVWRGAEFLHALNSSPEWDWRQAQTSLAILGREAIDFERLVSAIQGVDPLPTTMNSELREIAWVDPDDGTCRERVALWELDTSAESPDDPILMDLLSETFGHSVIGRPCFLLSHRDLGLAKRVLISILEVFRDWRYEVRIDFNHGTVLSGAETLEWLGLEPEWDWREIPSGV